MADKRSAETAETGAQTCIMRCLRLRLSLIPITLKQNLIRIHQTQLLFRDFLDVLLGLDVDLLLFQLIGSRFLVSDLFGQALFSGGVFSVLCPEIPAFPQNGCSQHTDDHEHCQKCDSAGQFLPSLSSLLFCHGSLTSFLPFF